MKKRVWSGIFASSTCSNVVKRTLYDIRDGNSYVVNKYADGNCWMSQSLGLKGPINLSPDTTDIASGTVNLLTSANSISYTGNAKPINTMDQYVCHSSRNLCVYNWYVATASAGVNGLSETDVLNSSLCPKNWRLPSNTEGQLQEIISTYNDSHIGSEGVYPFNFVYGNWWISGGGWYLDRVELITSTAATPDSRWPNEYFRNYILFGQTNRIQMYIDGSQHGMQIRCLAR